MSRLLKSCLSQRKRFDLVKIRLFQVDSCWGQGKFFFLVSHGKNLLTVMTSAGLWWLTLTQLKLFYSSFNLWFPGRQQFDVSVIKVCAGVIFWCLASPECDQKILNLLCISCTDCFLLHDKSITYPEGIRLLVQCVCRRTFIPRSNRHSMHMLHNICILVFIKQTVQK